MRTACTEPISLTVDHYLESYLAYESFLVWNICGWQCQCIVTTAVSQSLLCLFIFCFLNFAETYVMFVSNISHVVGNLIDTYSFNNCAKLMIKQLVYATVRQAMDRFLVPGNHISNLTHYRCYSVSPDNYQCDWRQYVQCECWTHNIWHSGLWPTSNLDGYSWHCNRWESNNEKWQTFLIDSMQLHAHSILCSLQMLTIFLELHLKWHLLWDLVMGLRLPWYLQWMTRM